MSKPAIPSVRASSSTLAIPLGAGASTRRTCHDRSKLGSTTQRGGARRKRRLDEMVAQARHDAAGPLEPAPQAGLIRRTESNISTATTVERSSGSRSMYQENASL